MSFQAYLDNIKAKTGKTPTQLKERAVEAGVLTSDTKAGDLAAWLKKEFDLGSVSLPRGERAIGRSSFLSSREYGTLAVQVARVADVERLLTLPPGAFRPPPKVTSAVVRLAFRPPSVDVGDEAVFERLVRGVFLQRRKTVQNALVPVAASLGGTAAHLLTRAGIDPSLRPEQLTLEDFARLSRAAR